MGMMTPENWPSLPQRVLNRVAAGNRAPHYTDRVLELAQRVVDGDESALPEFEAEIDRELDKIFPPEEEDNGD